VYIHLLDGTEDDPGADLDMLNNELRQFSSAISKKPQLIVVNKLDVTEVRERREELTHELKARTGIWDRPGEVSICFISAVTGEGVDAMLGKVVELLAATAKSEVEEDDALMVPVPRPSRRQTPNSITADGRVFQVNSEELERLVIMADTRDNRVLLQLWNEMRRCGVAKMLEEAGIEAGDTIRIGRSEVAWF
jgi:GTP-binding protein